MYRINLLPRNVLITTDEVIAASPVEDVPGVKNILQAIQIAEDRFVKQAIGYQLYDDLRNSKNELITDINIEFLEGEDAFNCDLTEGTIANAIEFCSTAYQNLWNEHLWKLTAESVIYVATLTNWSRHTASGEMVNNPKSISADNGSGGNSIDLADIKWKMSKIQQDRIDPLIAATQEYLFLNRASYPLFNVYNYTGNCGRNELGNINSNGVSYQRKTPWIHVYDRHRRRDRDCDNDRW